MSITMTFECGRGQGRDFDFETRWDKLSRRIQVVTSDILMIRTQAYVLWTKYAAELMPL